MLSVEHAFERLEEEQRKAENDGLAQPDTRAMKWKSFRALPREDISNEWKDELTKEEPGKP